MSFGFLGSYDIPATTDELLFTASVPQTFNIRLANRNPNDVRVRIAIGTGGAPALADYVDYDALLPANGILEDTGIVCSAGEKIWVYSNTANVSARSWGMRAITGYLGSSDLVGGAAETLLFTASKNLTANIRFANRTTAKVKVRVAIGTGGSSVAKDYISYDVTIPARGILEEKGVILTSGEKVWVASNISAVSVRAHSMY